MLTWDPDNGSYDNASLVCPEVTAEAQLYHLIFAHWLLNGVVQLALCIAGNKGWQIFLCDTKIFSRHPGQRGGHLPADAAQDPQHVLQPAAGGARHLGPRLHPHHGARGSEVELPTNLRKISRCQEKAPTSVLIDS